MSLELGLRELSINNKQITLPIGKNPMEFLPSPSDEQQEIISCFLRGFNAKVEAVAGAGKTTTLLLLALEAKNKFNCKTLILTYNRDLKDEINDKINGLKLEKYCNVYTYHGYASKMYRANIHNDKLLHHYLTMGPCNTSSYPIILVDEVQDMNPDYHRLVGMIIKHGDMLVIVGDRRQCINEYLQASSEYLVNYANNFNTGRPWKELLLRTSYRLTPHVANFVNKHILKEDIIIPGNFTSKNVKPIYHYGVWDMDYLVRRMHRKYTPNDVVILVPSIKCTNHRNSPIGKLLSRHHDNILFCVKDNDTSNETTHNKIVITSYNSMKGRERKCVILTGFDESYFEYYDKKWPKTNELLPNIMYVAATRASERLIIIQDKNKLPFRTIDKLQLPIDADIKGNEHDVKPAEKTSDSARKITDLIKHRNLTDTLSLLELISTEIIITGDKILPYQNIVQFNGYYEDMRRYYGLLITLYAQYLREGDTYLGPMDENNAKALTDIYRQYNALLRIPDKNMKQWMELTVLYSAIVDKYHFYKDQIPNYDWVDEAFVIETSNRILSIIPQTGTFEYACPHTSETALINSYNLVGVIDYLSEEELWEFKCTSSLADDHKIQCGAYISLYYIETGKLLPCKLFNVRTGELLLIKVTDPNIFLQILAMK